MRSFAQASFWDAYRRLPKHVRRQARESYQFFISDPHHPKVRTVVKGYWSVTVKANWRIIFRFEGEDVYDVELVDYH